MVIVPHCPVDDGEEIRNQIGPLLVPVRDLLRFRKLGRLESAKEAQGAIAFLSYLKLVDTQVRRIGLALGSRVSPCPHERECAAHQVLHCQTSPLSLALPMRHEIEDFLALLLGKTPPPRIVPRGRSETAYVLEKRHPPPVEPHLKRISLLETMGII